MEISPRVAFVLRIVTACAIAIIFVTIVASHSEALFRQNAPNSAPIAYVVPNVVGLSYADAQTVAHDAGLRLQRERELLSPACSTVVKQIPQPGGLLPAGGTIVVEVHDRYAKAQP